jgi:hypothetical protein
MMYLEGCRLAVQVTVEFIVEVDQSITQPSVFRNSEESM